MRSEAGLHTSISTKLSKPFLKMITHNTRTWLICLKFIHHEHFTNIFVQEDTVEDGIDAIFGLQTNKNA
jgi:hypothetical protein